ncbi:MAG: hypothetical protein HZC48_05375 [Nitrospirae bacterium]|nr:hypothetical protein [Nitrospirota bacterium]
MRKKNSMAGIVLMTLLLILSGCGEQLGSPAADSGDTGILIKSVSIIGEEPAGGDNEIDAALHLCPPDFTEIEDGLFIANAQLTINAHAVGFDPFPASIEQCDITYLKGNESPDSPIIESLTIYPNCTLTEGDGNECNFVMMDVDRKIKWWDDANAINFPSTYPTPYTVRYDCTFMNQYGNSGTFQVEYDILLADWNYC